MNNSLARLRWLAFVTALMAAASAGCIPPGIAWFPDSTGFVYTGGKDKKQLMVFEVGQKQGRALPIKAGSPAWPAVSPDSKRIALAWVLRGDDTISRLTVLVVDRAGKVIHRSREFADLNGDVVQVWWSPQGDKLLVSEGWWARLYDLKTEQLIRLPGPAAIFGTTPVRPDGKAFLIHNFEEYLLADWNGKVQAIKPRFAALVKDNRDERRQALQFPIHAIDPRWDRQAATVLWGGSRFRIDTDRRSLTMEDGNASRTTLGAPVRISHSFPGDATVRQVHPSVETGHPFVRDDPRLEVIRPGRDPEVVVKKAGVCMFFPSPDGKFFAVRWAEDNGAMLGASKKQDRILVLNARGDDVADLNVAE